MNDLPDINIREEDGILVSKWVVGIYEEETLSKYRVVRALRTSKGVEWEYADGQGVDADVFPIKEPTRWVPITE